VTRHGDVIPATGETRAAAFAAAFSDSDDGTTKKPEGRGFALAFNDLLTGEPDTISGAASGGMRSARAARPPRRASWSDFFPACSERVREDEDHPARQHAPLPALGARSSHAGGSGAKIAAPPCGMSCFPLTTPLLHLVRVSYG
jgi:hypothetical protein